LPPDATAAVLLRTNKAADLFRDALLPFGVKLEQRPKAKGEDEKLAVAVLRAMVAPHNDRAILNMVKAAGGNVEAVKAKAAMLMTSVATMIGVDIQVCEMAVAEPDNIRHLAANFVCCGVLNDLQGKSQFRDAQNWLQNLATTLPLPCTIGDLLLAAQAREPEAPRGRIECVTIHQMKGREKSVIFLPAFEDEVMPGNAKGEDFDELLRLAYVAVTRAQLEVHVSYCTERPNDYKPWIIEPRHPSRFALQATGQGELI
jgi:superfamily I DNA/RNA helicase